MRETAVPGACVPSTRSTAPIVRLLVRVVQLLVYSSVAGTSSTGSSARSTSSSAPSTRIVPLVVRVVLLLRVVAALVRPVGRWRGECLESCYVVLHRITSHHVMLRHLFSCYYMLHACRVASRHVLSRRVISRVVFSCHGEGKQVYDSQTFNDLHIIFAPDIHHDLRSFRAIRCLVSWLFMDFHGENGSTVLEITVFEPFPYT